METKDFSLDELNVTLLDQSEIEEINGGDNLFYDLGVAVGTGIAKAYKWWNSQDFEHLY
ncbi:hypothetical protein [Ohtaekwangia sp.]|uniref:hypothetical protein n=1 Tax=Ohtaekwangia sp. TaxID=2066019 RepID=UPI002FDD6105